MKSKRIIKISLALAIVVGAYIYIDRSQCKSMDLLFQANLEALAGDESSNLYKFLVVPKKRVNAVFLLKMRMEIRILIRGKIINISNFQICRVADIFLVWGN